MQPVFIGLTGGVAAGKSTALAALADAGIPTLSADRVVHEVYEDPEVIELVSDRLGSEVIAEGAVNRDAVARAVFNEPEARAWIEQLIWPRVGQRILDFRSSAGADNAVRAMVVEVPLLFEAGMDQAFDCTIAVVAEDGLRAERAQSRGHEEVAAREERQLGQDVKAERATAVVINDGSIDELRAKIRAAVDSCIANRP